MRLTRFMQAGREEVFAAFVDPRKLEKWCYPEGHKLSVIDFRPYSGGHYQYLYNGPNGTYRCFGAFESFILNEELVTLDHTMIDPLGNVLDIQLKGIIFFRDQGHGTEMTITVEGFKDDASEESCQKGWIDALSNLSEFLSQGKSEREMSVSL